jgi:aspartate-semialdehyde dehydrogenase
METAVKADPVIAIAGVTGAVGAELIATLDKRRFPVGKLKALASARSAGKTLDFRGEKIVIEELTEDSFAGVDIALFSAGGGISRKFAPIAVNAGAVVIDNSSAFRMVPLWPIHKKNRIKRVILSTYQAASGAGAAALLCLQSVQPQFGDRPRHRLQ